MFHVLFPHGEILTCVWIKAILHMNVRNAAFPPTSTGYLNADQSALKSIIDPIPTSSRKWFLSDVVCWHHVTVEKTTIGRIPIPSYLFLFHTYSCSLLIMNNLASANKLHVKQQSLQGTCRSSDKQAFVWLKVKFGTDELLAQTSR